MAFTAVIHVPDAEAHFRADEWLDAKASRQPVIYISPNNIYALHSSIVESIDAVVSLRVPYDRPEVRLIVFVVRLPKKTIPCALFSASSGVLLSLLLESSVALEPTRFR